MMTHAKLAELQKEGQAHIDAARAIAAKHDVDQSEWPEADVADYNAVMAKGAEVLVKIKTAKHDLAVIQQAKDLADEIGVPAVGDPVQDGDVRQRVKALGVTITDSPEFKALMGQFPGGRVPNGTRVQSNPIPVKSLITGDSSTSAGAFVVTERTNIVEMLGRKPLKVRDLVSVRSTTSDVVEFVQETSHTNAAAVVAEATSAAAPTAPGGAGALVPSATGGYKPEGAWAFVVVPANVKTIAEWVPLTKRALADVGQLEGLINDELAEDVKESEENQIVNGDGVGENFRGIANTSGIQTQAFSVDIFQSIRKGITKARTVGRVNPTAILMNPADAESVDLAKDLNGQYYYGGPQSIGPRSVFGLPVVESESQVAGFATLGDWSKAVIWDRQQTTITFSDSHADFFVRNLVAILAEERLAFGVVRPSAFVVVDVVA